MKASVKKRARFCQSMASWLYCTEWHYTTLLAVCIDVIKDLPENTDHLIHDLLEAFDEKPSQQCIVDFLSGHAIVSHWFRYLSVKPKITKHNLQAVDAPALCHSQLPVLRSLADVAEWLNVSHSQLEWLSDLKRRDLHGSNQLKHYHYSVVKKRSGGLRLIESPKSHLKGIQQKINESILAYVDIHPAAQGFVKGKSCRTHASLHVGKAYLFLFDLAHCFQSITWVQVYAVFMTLGYGPIVSQCLTALCTHQCYLNDSVIAQLDEEQQRRLRQRHLPQGSPCSPALSNRALYQLDKRLTGLATKLSLDYSRYADDLAFSGQPHRNWDFLEPLIGSICMEEGFVLHHRKSRQVRAHQKQRVTGIVVNEKINIDRQYYDQLKATLYNCVRYGLSSQNRQQHPDFEAHLLGRITYVQAINPSKGEKLLALFKQIKSVAGTELV